MISKKDVQAFGEKHRILRQDNAFIYILPHPKLRAHIAVYTISFPTSAFISDKTTILPYGNAGLVVEYSRKNLTAHLYGAATKPCLIYTPSEMIVTVDFKPAGLYLLLSVNQNELTDKILSFEEVSSALNKRIFEMIEKANCIAELVADLDTLFLENMHGSYPTQLNMAINHVMDYSGMITVKKLANDIHYSERHLSRIFQQYVGTGVKTFARLVRMNAACLMLQNFENSIEVVSELAGFQDPSHFVRDFELLSGISPKTYRANMSDFHNEIATSLPYN
ncbi:MAG: helix-turn-helix transcriptional regulator [Defluviitaleaceae bacterium]|nr:helix-turn-helix transcriptional regulator [Defluviitaleaceae bacterium]